MIISFLGYNKKQTSLISFLRNLGHTVHEIEDKISDLSSYDLVISFGYRHILSAKLIESASRPILNLHISYLPFNKGAHPNFWSWIEGTPSGVTIHEIDSGIDTGPIVSQCYAEKMNDSMTFSESHKQLIRLVEKLFKDNVDDLLSGRYQSFLQTGEGSYHASKDLPKWMSNWDMPITEAIEEYKQHE